MSNMSCYILLVALWGISSSCNSSVSSRGVITGEVLRDTGKLLPVHITDSVAFDTDDPAIWINPADPAKSLVLGTDKDSRGGLYVFDLEGKIVHKVDGLKRPNNVDIAYGFLWQGIPTDIAVVTEREAKKVRIYRLPDMQPIDQGGIAVFSGVEEGDPMGIALYKAPDSILYVIVGRKTGPSGSYLWQYRLSGGEGQSLHMELVRKFGQYSGKKEIEAIAVDKELGYVYYSDEQTGVRKYYADPGKGDQELALFATSGFTDDHEGISIYPTGIGSGYILVSNQQKNTFMLYPREGHINNKHRHDLVAEIPLSTLESDGSEVTAVDLGSRFPKGLFVAMSNGRVFHYYDWRDIQRRIDQAIGRAQAKQP